MVLTIISFAQKVSKDSLKNNLSSLTNGDVQRLLPQITAKSPNVSGLERHGDYPVNMYAGLPNIEIPIYEIKVGNLVVPIKLAYHASGNKVTDNASFVGLGWSLVGDYVVTRNLRGLADERDFSNSNSLLQKNLQPLLCFFIRVDLLLGDPIVFTGFHCLCVLAVSRSAVHYLAGSYGDH